MFQWNRRRESESFFSRYSLCNQQYYSTIRLVISFIHSSSNPLIRFCLQPERYHEELPERYPGKSYQRGILRNYLRGIRRNYLRGILKNYTWEVSWREHCLVYIKTRATTSRVGSWGQSSYSSWILIVETEPKVIFVFFILLNSRPKKATLCWTNI